MGVDASPWRTAGLAAATVLAVASGLLWWTGNTPPPSAGTTVNPLSPAAPPTEPPAPVAVDTSPDTYPAPAEILSFDVAEVDALLPPHDDEIERRVGVLTADGVIDYSGVVPADGRYLLEYVCQGDGELEIETGMPDGQSEIRYHPCDGTVDGLELTTTSTGHATIRLVAHTSAVLGVAAQLTGR
jgi:hypothetical protein